jgi:two-component system, chemotaxis family, sensor kinase Cph1
MDIQTQLITVDETTCDREPIHILGHIQPQGFFIATDSSFTILQISANLPEFLEISAEEMIGKEIASFGFIGLEDKLRLSQMRPVKKANYFEVAVKKKDTTIFFDAIVHFSGSKLIIEFEPCIAELPPKIYHELLYDLTYLSTGSQSSTEVLNHAATLLKKYIGYDRVMIYRFMKDGHGQVVAEEKEEYLEPLLGIYYPASDIPKQARELFIKNVVRIIADVDAKDVALIPYLVNNEPTDLTFSNLRSVSPMHIQYLKNMGVKASFSISIIIDGALWGLIACHQYKSAKFLTFAERQNCVMISRFLSASIQSWLHLEEKDLKNSITTVINTLVSQIKQNWNIPFGLTNYGTTLINMFDGCSVAMVFEDNIYTLGETPSEQEIRELAQWLGDTTEKYFETNRLPQLFSPAKTYKQIASGLFSITLSKEMKEYILWFKPELIEQVNWGGNPKKAVEINIESGNVTLTPRKSFAKWTEALELHSAPWKDAEIAGALQLREELLQIINFKANELRRFTEKLRMANQELNAFSYTVSHDLRTPLTSIYSYCELLLEDAGRKNDTPSKELLQLIIKNVTRMNEMIRAILEYAKINKTDINKTMVVMPAILRDVIAAIKSTLHKEVTIQIEQTPSLFAEPAMVTQIFQNLIENAAKYSITKEKPHIVIRGEEHDEEVIYSVKDNGIGIDMKYADKIFEIFSRLHTESTYPGYGVGLSIVKRIMERFNGKVWLESKRNQGSIFYISFPKQQQHDQQL